MPQDSLGRAPDDAGAPKASDANHHGPPIQHQRQQQSHQPAYVTSYSYSYAPQNQQQPAPQSHPPQQSYPYIPQPLPQQPPPPHPSPSHYSSPHRTQPPPSPHFISPYHPSGYSHTPPPLPPSSHQQHQAGPPVSPVRVSPQHPYPHYSSAHASAASSFAAPSAGHSVPPHVSPLSHTQQHMSAVPPQSHPAPPYPHPTTGQPSLQQQQPSSGIDHRMVPGNFDQHYIPGVIHTIPVSSPSVQSYAHYSHPSHNAPVLVAGTSAVPYSQQTSPPSSGHRHSFSHATSLPPTHPSPLTHPALTSPSPHQQTPHSHTPQHISPTHPQTPSPNASSHGYVSFPPARSVSTSAGPFTSPYHARRPSYGTDPYFSQTPSGPNAGYPSSSAPAVPQNQYVYPPAQYPTYDGQVTGQYPIPPQLIGPSNASTSSDGATLPNVKKPRKPVTGRKASKSSADGGAAKPPRQRKPAAPRKKKNEGIGQLNGAEQQPKVATKRSKKDQPAVVTSGSTSLATESTVLQTNVQHPGIVLQEPLPESDQVNVNASASPQLTESAPPNPSDFDIQAAEQAYALLYRRKRKRIDYAALVAGKIRSAKNSGMLNDDGTPFSGADENDSQSDLISPSSSTTPSEYGSTGGMTPPLVIGGGTSGKLSPAALLSATTAASSSATASTDANKLYCICRQPLRQQDDSQFFIACDGCDEWFHGDCVHVTEEEAGGIAKWVCSACQADNGLSIVYKEKCHANGCGRWVEDEEPEGGREDVEAEVEIPEKMEGAGPSNLMNSSDTPASSDCPTAPGILSIDTKLTSRATTPTGNITAAGAPLSSPAQLSQRPTFLPRRKYCSAACAYRVAKGLYAKLIDTSNGSHLPLLRPSTLPFTEQSLVESLRDRLILFERARAAEKENEVLLEELIMQKTCIKSLIRALCVRRGRIRRAIKTCVDIHERIVKGETLDDILCLSNEKGDDSGEGEEKESGSSGLANVRVCCFDQRIVDEWRVEVDPILVFVAPETGAQVNSKQVPVDSSESKSAIPLCDLAPYLCTHAHHRPCPLHETWERVKYAEVEMEIKDWMIELDVVRKRTAGVVALMMARRRLSRLAHL